MTAAYTSLSPHLSDDYTPLQEIVLKALRRYGEMEVGTMSEDAILLFMDFANQIVSDYNRHPYRVGLDLVDFYTAFQDSRPIPDDIVMYGLVYMYSSQQGSAKTEFYRGLYYANLHKKTFHDRWGNVRLEMQTVDRRKTFEYPDRPDIIETET